MLAKFRGKKYRVKVAQKFRGVMKDADAYTTDPQASNREIVFLDSIWKSPRLLEILIHESIHACNWDLSEDAVYETAKDIAKFLKQMGIVIRKELPNGTV